MPRTRFSLPASTWQPWHSYDRLVRRILACNCICFLFLKQWERESHMLGRHGPTGTGTRAILTRFASSHRVNGLFWYTTLLSCFETLFFQFYLSISANLILMQLTWYSIKRPFIQWNWCLNTSENYIWNKQRHQTNTILFKYKRHSHWDQKL